MKKKFFSLLLVTMFSMAISSTAQNICGRIIDERSQPMPFVNVVLVNRADSAFIAGAITKDDGTFSIAINNNEGLRVGDQKQGICLLKVSSVGYIVKYIDVWQDSSAKVTKNVGNIQLQPSTNTLGEVVVKGNKPTMKMVTGGLEINVQNSLLSQAGTALDILSELPRVNVSSSGNVSVFGKGTPEIYINGKKLRDEDELRQLTSKEIKSVEVITAPGAQYNAEATSIIRINTIKRLSDYVGLYAITRGSYTKEAAGRAGASFTYCKNGFEMNLYPYYKNVYVAENNDFGNLLHLPDHDFRILQHGEFSDRTQTFVPSAKINYDFNANHSVGISLNLNKTLNYNGSMPSYYKVFRDEAEQGEVVQTSTHDWDVNHQDVNVYYLGHMGKWNLQTDGTFVHTKVERGQHISETSLELGNRFVNTSSTQDSRLLAGKVITTWMLPKGELSFGTELTHSHIDANNHNPEGYISDSDNEIHERNYAFFASYGKQLGHWNVEAGLRYEHVNSSYYSFGILDPAVSRSYSDYFPNVSVAWNKGKWGIQLAYGKKTRRPAYGQLRSYQQYDNRYAYEGGSPDLQPTSNHEVELMTTWKWLNIGIDYSYQRDYMLWRSDIYKTDEAALTHWINIDHKQDLSASVTMRPKFGWYQPQLTILYWQQLFDSFDYGFVTSLRRPEFAVNLMNKFVMDETSWIALQGIIDSAHDSGSQEHKPFGIINLRAYKSFCKGRLALNLYVDDLFNNQRERWTMRTHSVEISKDCNNYTRGVELQLIYRFNITSSKYKGTGAGNNEKDRF